MPENKLYGAEIQELLRRKQAGTLPPEAVKDLDFYLRSQQQQTRADVELTVGGAATGLLEAAQPVGRYIRSEAPKAILPTAGGLAGAAAGGLVATPTVFGVPAGVIGGEMAGSAAGEGLNQLLGITEPSGTQVALAAASPLAGRALGGLARAGRNFIAPRLPGAAGALHEVGTETMKGLPAIIRPKVSVDDLYARVEQFNPPITMGHTRAALAKLRGREGQVAEGLQSSEIKSITAGLEKLAGEPGADVPFQQVRANLRRLGDRVETTRAQGGEVHGAAKLLKKAIEQDLEVAASVDSGLATQARTALKTANQAARKDFAANDLAEAIEKGGISDVRSGESLITRVNPAKIQSFIRKDQYFRDSLDPGELKKIDETLRQLAKIPAPPSGSGVVTGSSRAVMGAGAGYAASHLLGLGPQEAGVVTGIASFAPYIVGRALVSDRGRATLLKIMQDQRGGLDHKALAALAQIVRSQTADEPPETGKEVDVGKPPR